MKSRRTYAYPALTALRLFILNGLTVIVPIAFTILLLIWIFHLVDNVLQPIIEAIYGHAITGLGFLIITGIVLLAGLAANSRAGRRFLKWIETSLAKVPIFGSIYFTIKTVMESLVGAGVNKNAFRKVVFVEWPAGGMKTIAFITNEQHDRDGRKIYSVYIPTSPTPQSGFYMIAYEEQITQCDIGVDEAMKMVISAGILSPGILDVGGPGKAKSL